MKTKGDELFGRIIYSDQFKQDVRTCRQVFGLPPDGEQSNSGIKKWYEAKSKRDYGRFLDVLGDLLLSQKLSQGFINQLESFDRILVPIGSFCLLSNTAAFLSKRIELPSSL